MGLFNVFKKKKLEDFDENEFDDEFEGDEYKDTEEVERDSVMVTFAKNNERMLTKESIIERASSIEGIELGSVETHLW